MIECCIKEIVCHSDRSIRTDLFIMPYIHQIRKIFDHVNIQNTKNFVSIESSCCAQVLWDICVSIRK